MTSRRRPRKPAARVVLALLLLVATLAAAPISATKTQYVAHLYSWPDGDGSWFFTLIPHQRQMTDREIMDDEAHRVHGVEELEPKFRDLHEFTHVYWFHRGHPAFTYPDPAVIERVWTLADRAHLELELPDELEQEHRGRN